MEKFTSYMIDSMKSEFPWMYEDNNIKDEWSDILKLLNITPEKPKNTPKPTIDWSFLDNWEIINGIWRPKQTKLTDNMPITDFKIGNTPIHIGGTYIQIGTEIYPINKETIDLLTATMKPNTNTKKINITITL